MATDKQISYASEKAAVSSSSASKKADYDVFINYCGIDSEHTLASSVCTAFRGMGLIVFLDKEVLEMDNFIPVETEEAMRTSFLHIAILSPKYAHSPSCLAQLSLMLKIGCTVIPVFYNVEPGNVRDVKGLFADAFEEYEKRSIYTSEKLLEWKRALHNVSFHCDEILKGNNDGGMLLKSIVNYAMHHMKKVQLKGAKHGVSLYEVVQERLKISFDALNEEEQEIFLDIACFFVGEEKSLAIAVWDGSEWSGAHGWEVLENKCLVEVDERNQIKMHDHIRDLGKEIAKERSPYRIWSAQQIMDIQRQAREGVLIRGIKAATDDFYKESSSHHSTPFEECMEFVRGCSANFKGLRPSILVVKGDYFTEEFAILFPALLWLRWIDFQEVALPSWLLLKQLRVLELPYANHLEELWTDAADPPFELRELNLENTQNFLRFPRKINYLKHLKRISLNCSANLHLSPFGSSYTPMNSLPEEFCLLESLEHLQLRGCVRLTSLPSNFGNLTNLRHLDLSSCWTLRTLPDSLKQLINLQYLNLGGCRKLTLTSERNYILENMTKLETLNLFACENLQKLPLHVTSQLSLRYLNVKGTKFRELPSTFGELRKLENLSIESEFLTMLPPSIVNLSSLTSLDVYNCRELEILPESIGNLASLTKFSISLCIKLKYLPESIGCLSSLTNLHITGCSEFETLPESIKNLASLTKLSIESCKKLKCLPESIGHLSSLTRLEIYRCGKLESLPESIRNLSSLTKLIMQHCVFKYLPDCMGYLPSLTSIDICNCYELKTVPESIGHLASLTHLYLYCCLELESLPESITHLSSLTNLHISECRKLVSLAEPVRSLNELEELSINSSLDKSLPKASAQLGNLRNLNMSGCPIKELAFLSCSLCNLESIYLMNIPLPRISIYKQCCPSLKTLHIDYNSQLVEIESLPMSIKTINLRNCTQLKSLPETGAQLSNLESMIIQNCPVTEWTFLSGSFSSSFCSLKQIELRSTLVSRISISQESCPSLENIVLDSNEHLVEIEALPISVKEINLSKCKMLKSINALCGMINLETLSIKDCGDNLDELPNLVSLKEFEIIETGDQPKKIQGLGNCSSLEKLRALTCCNVPAIQNLEHMERLQRLELSAACNISAFEPFLQTIKKWPSECMICARKEHSVQSVLNSSVFPGLTLVDSCVEEVVSKYGDTLLSLKCRQRRSSNATAMVCFEINSRFAYTDVTFRNKKFASSMNVGEGKWILLGVFKQPSLLTEEYKLSKRGYCSELGRGMLVMGDQERVVETFKKLLLFFGV